MTQRLLITLVLLIGLATSVVAQKARRTTARKAQPSPPAEKSPGSYKQLTEAATQARNNLITATENYQASLEKLLAIYGAEEKRATELVEKRRKLLDLGVIARREVTESEEKLAEAGKKSEEVRHQIGTTNQLMAEAIAAEEDAKKAPEPGAPAAGRLRSNLVMVRYVGFSSWSLTEAGKVQAFFLGKFGRDLPVSAFGQTATHDQLGFDHRQAMDVAVHPDSAEGRALLAWLQSLGIPFIAFRAPVAGSATGVHIHIGPPSHRLSTKM